MKYLLLPHNDSPNMLYSDDRIVAEPTKWSDQLLDSSNDPNLAVSLSDRPSLSKKSPLVNDKSGTLPCEQQMEVIILMT